MLEALFGNKNVQNILLFLFVNGKCYGSQLQRQLEGSLTPIQKALARLEDGEIIVSYFEGKTKLYQFNPSYPLVSELEQFLKAAYSLLPPQEKKRFSYISHEQTTLAGGIKGLLAIWKRLSIVSQMTFRATTKSKDGGGWNGQGKGEVSVVRDGDAALIFYEKGSWKDPQGHDIDFSNVFRWTLDRQRKVISLEHLRRGIDNPVFLFHLALDGPNTLSSIDSHLCAGDAYFGKVLSDPHNLKLKWRVIGPKKNEEIETHYF